MLNKEVYAPHASPNGTFGYQNRYDEYRHPDGAQVAGEFRSSLNFWHMGRIFGSNPSLNGTFVTCTPSKRIHVNTTDNTLWVMVNHRIKARRQLAPIGSSFIK